MHLGHDRRSASISRAQADLEILRHLVTNHEIVLVTYRRLNGPVEIETSEPQRLGRHHATERDDPSLGGPRSEVHDHRSHWLVDRKVKADRRRHGRLKEYRVCRSGCPGRLLERSALDRSGGRWHRQEHFGPAQP